MNRYPVFSDAIRAGAKLRQQAQVSVIDDRGRTCAIGAGLHAMGYKKSVMLDQSLNGDYQLASGPYPYLKQLSCCPYPECDLELDESKRDLLLLITHLNDSHHWTREAIASWLSDEEEKLGMVVIAESEEKEFVTV